MVGSIPRERLVMGSGCLLKKPGPSEYFERS